MGKNFISRFFGSNGNGNISAATKQETAPAVFPRIELKRTIPICGHKLYLAQNTEGRWGVIRRNFEVIVPFEFDYGLTIQNADDNGYLGNFERQETYLVWADEDIRMLDAYYTDIYRFEMSDFLCVIQEKKCGVLKVTTSDVKSIIPCRFKFIAFYQYHNSINGFIAKDKQGIYTLYDLKGNIRCEGFSGYFCAAAYILLYPKGIDISPVSQTLCRVYSQLNREIILEDVILDNDYRDHFLIFHSGEKYYLVTEAGIAFCGNKYIKPIEKSPASYPLRFLTVDDNGFEIVRHIDGEIME